MGLLAFIGVPKILAIGAVLFVLAIFLAFVLAYFEYKRKNRNL